MVKDALLTFGKYTWWVLDLQDDRALIITENIIELRWYHKGFEDITWADCALRDYLKQDFYHQFSQDEKAKIITVTKSNPDNSWFKTKGGIETLDTIFLLSLEGVCTYFGDSRAKLQIKGRQVWFIEDENNGNRQAKYRNEFHW